MKRTLGILTVTTVLVLCMASTAFAGGWSLTTFDEVPSEFQAGITYRLGYTILAHGKTPVDVGTTAVRFHGPDDETLTFVGEPDGKGHYTAEVVIPDSGQWSWEVTQGTYDVQELGTMTVGAAPGLAVAGPSGLLTALRVILPVATLLALLLVSTQVVTLVRNNREATIRNVV